LILAILGPLLTMQSRPIFEALNRVFRWRKSNDANERLLQVDDLLDEQENG
jgi:hypothetical protein